MLRFAQSVGVALLALLTAVVLALASTVSSAVQLVATTALIMSGTFTPTPPPAFVDMARYHFIVPTHPSVNFDAFVPVTTPEEAWPVTGLRDLPFGESVAIGLSDLENAMATYGNDNLVIFGHSQSSVIAYLEKRKLAEQFPIGTPAPDIDFVTIGTLNLPNGGVMTRFWGLYLPFVDFYFNGPAPTDTQFDTSIITQRWDGFADFPIYPIILPAVLNAVAGFFYTHENYEAVTLAPDPSKYFVGTYGDTSYYFFETENLPLYGPLRSLGVPEALIDVVEPLTEFVVELGYRRDIPPWVPSPARLIPMHDPAEVVADFADAVVETVENTLALVGQKPAAAPVEPAVEERASKGAAGSTFSGDGRDRPGSLGSVTTKKPAAADANASGTDGEPSPGGPGALQANVGEADMGTSSGRGDGSPTSASVGDRSSASGAKGSVGAA